MKNKGVRVGTYLLWLILAASIPLLLFNADIVWRLQEARRAPEQAALAPSSYDLVPILLIGTLLLALGLIAAAYLARGLAVALRAGADAGVASGLSGIPEGDQLFARWRTVLRERAATGAALRESAGPLRDLVATLDLAAIMAREMDGTIRFWSHGCEQIYGWTREEAVGRRVQELLRTEFPVPLKQIEQALLKSAEWKGDLIHRRRDGTRVVAAAHKALRGDTDGCPRMVMESLVDVTALRDAEEAMRALNEGLEQRVRDEVAARQEAQQRAGHAERIRAIGQLAGGIAHDFNNVLQAVAGGAALIARRPRDTEAVERLIRVIIDAAARGASITRRMLILARRGDLRAEPIEAESLLAGMQETFIHTLGTSIAVSVEVAPELPRMLADKAQLETALVNLATNARDAMPDGGELRLRAGAELIGAGAQPHRAGLAVGLYIWIAVVDNGIGMTLPALDRAGEPFFTTKEVGKGTGLGLSMVKAFAEQSGGWFALESTLGLGTTGTIWLPSVPGDVRRPAKPVAEPVSQPRLTGRILLVDDDKPVRDTLMEQLEDLGHKVLAASGGTDALAILQARDTVDLMITDLSMPGMNGLTLIKEAHRLRPALPAILLTGYAGNAVSLEACGGAPRGTYTLMRKPATSAVLGARVMALLERS